MLRGPPSTQRPLDLGSSWANLLVASLAAAFALMGPGGVAALLHLSPYPLGILAGALLGFVLHEHAHERAAFRNGCWARFVLHPLGLAITIISGLLPFAVIAPGAVSVACPHWGWGGGGGASEEEIAAAGVRVNMALAAAGLAAMLAARAADAWWPALFASGFASINAWVALFNLIPFPPLDGWRLSRINPGRWLAYFAAAVAIWLATMLL